jgi:hypothetical protein
MSFNDVSWSFICVCTCLSLVACSDDPAPSKNPALDMSGDMSLDQGEDSAADLAQDMALDLIEEPDQDISGDMAEPLTALKCTDTPRPARCDEEPGTFDRWQPASVVAALSVEGDTCCFDLNGDGVVDNNMGELATSLGPQFGLDINMSIAEKLADGGLALIIESDDLRRLDGASSFSMNFMFGEPVDAANPAPKAEGANHYLIKRESFEQGVWPQARIQTARLMAGGAFTAGPGDVAFSLDLFGIQLDLRILNARIEGEVDAANSDLLTKGLATKQGVKLGGIIRAQDIFDGVNQFEATQCACLGYTGQTRGDIVQVVGGVLEDTRCDPDFTVGTCDPTDDVQNVCRALIEKACPVVGLAPALFDMRVDGARCGEDGQAPCDAISVGAKLTAYGAIIDGVTAP